MGSKFGTSIKVKGVKTKRRLILDTEKSRSAKRAHHITHGGRLCARNRTPGRTLRNGCSIPQMCSGHQPCSMASRRRHALRTILSVPFWHVPDLRASCPLDAVALPQARVSQQDHVDDPKVTGRTSVKWSRWWLRGGTLNCKTASFKSRCQQGQLRFCSLVPPQRPLATRTVLQRQW